MGEPWIVAPVLPLVIEAIDPRSDKDRLPPVETAC
jgi:hypothetical protein